MEELRNFVRDRVNARKVRAFEAIAMAAGKRKIVEGGVSAVLLGDDVIVVKRKFGKLRREVTILATVLRPFAHSLLEGCVHL